MSKETIQGAHDPKRILAVRETRLLDTAPEEAFDRLARLASRFLGTPAAAVTLVDEDRQFLKSCIGIPEPWASRREMPMAYSYCQHAVASREPLLIRDAREHPLVKDSPAVSENRAIAYLGIPLVTSAGHALGTLCVIDDHPREWTPEQVEVLRELAASVMTEIELRAAVRETEAAETLGDIAERERREKTALLESSAEGIYGIDDQGRCTFLNPAASRMLGYSPEEALGRNMHQLIHHTRADGSAYPEGECPIYQAFHEGRPVRVDEDVLWRKDGTRFPAEYSSSPIYSGGAVRGAVVTLQDITERKRAEERLRQSEERYRILAETAPDAIVTMDEDSVIVYANPATEQVFGCTPAELIGQSMTLLIPERLRRAHRAGVVRYLETGKRHIPWRGLELPGLHKSGKEVTLEVAFAEHVQEGRHLFTGTMRDITERKREEEVQRLFIRASQTLSAASLDYTETLRSLARLSVPALGDWCSVYVVREGGGVERLEITHADPQKESLARALGEYPVDPQGAHPALRVLETGESVLLPDVPESLIEAVAQDDDHLRILRGLGVRSAMVVPLRARGRILGALTLATAESGRRYREEDLATAQEFASRAALAVDNARLLHESQEANRAKSEFLAAISHELRTPLNAMTGYTALMREGIPEPLPPQSLQYVERISLSSQHLLQLIEEILTFSRLETGREEVSAQLVDVAHLADEVRAIIEPLAAEKGLRFVMEIPDHPLQLETDPRKVRQILLNLLDNAVKFTETGEVGFSARQDDGAIVFEVRDTGVGIAAEDQRRIYDAFWQVEQGNTRTAGGTGLGLSVTRRLVQLLGGSIDLQSRPGRGTTFAVRLPVQLAGDDSSPGTKPAG
jgi:PAS domain S-box-containing protein